MNEPVSLVAKIDSGFGRFVVEPIGAVIFWDVAFWDNGQPGEVQLPIVVLWLIAGALFFTLRYRFVFHVKLTPEQIETLFEQFAKDR